MKNNLFTRFLGSVTAKVFIIGIIGSVLAIGLIIVGVITSERESRFRKAGREISQEWGQEQTLIGPLLTVPYKKIIKLTEDNIVKEQEITEHLTLLPKTLDTLSALEPEIRARGIYETVVYRSQNNIKAVFDESILDNIPIPKKDIMWEQAEIAFGISDLKGVEEQLYIKINGKQQELFPGVSNSKSLINGVYRNISLTENSLKEGINIDFDFSVRGSRNLMITPTAEENTSRMTSSWPSPSFNGNTLPSTRTVDENGFKSEWKVSYFAQNFPRFWFGDERSHSNQQYHLKDSSFGAELILVADVYQQHYRALQYGVLFIIITFGAFFLFEVLNALELHPLQYLFIGSALVIFYLLLVSLSEHIGFSQAYGIASIATVTLITAYSKSVLYNGYRATIMFFIMSSIYSFLYTLLQVEDYALLIGSIALFTLLSVVMYITRNINWYKLPSTPPNNG